MDWLELSEYLGDQVQVLRRLRTLLAIKSQLKIINDKRLECCWWVCPIDQDKRGKTVY